MRTYTLRITVLFVFILAILLVGCGGSEFSAPPAGPPVNAYYVADTGNNRIVRFTSFDTPTGFVSFGTAGAGINQFQSPTDIAFDNANNVYIVDQGNGRIVRIASDFQGTNWTTFGSVGAATGQFQTPTCIAIDALNRIYITDTGNKRIVRMDDMAGTNWITCAAASGTPFVTPYGIRVNSSGNIFVSDQGANAVYELTDMSGTSATKLATVNLTKSTFNQPVGIDLDFQNKLYITDSLNQRIVRVDNIAGANPVEWNSGGVLSTFMGLTVLGRDQILIADTSKSRIYRILDINGSSPSSYGTPGAGADQLQSPLSIRAR